MVLDDLETKYNVFLILDVVERVRAGLDPPYRPLIPKTTDDQEKQTVALMIECWAEDPASRPDLDRVLSRLKAINGGR